MRQFVIYVKALLILYGLSIIPHQTAAEINRLAAT